MPASCTSESPTSATPATPHDNPQIGITPTELIDDFVHERVRFIVNDIAVQYRLSRADRDDLSQEIYLALCEAAVRYDPAQASRHTFACRVIVLAAAHRARSIRNVRRCPVRSPLMLSELQRDARCAGLRAPRWTEPTSIDLGEDLRFGVSRLSRRQQLLVQELKTQSPTAIAAERNRHPSSIYREITRIRHQIEASGLDPAI